MNTLKIGLRDHRNQFRPGEVIEGAIGWELDAPPKSIEIRLFWHTRGKGTEDVGIIDQILLDQPGTQGAEAFRFLAPRHPPSFSGKLISLLWAIEVVALPGNLSARCELVIGPQGAEVVLGASSASPTSPR